MVTEHDIDEADNKGIGRRISEPYSEHRCISCGRAFKDSRKMRCAACRENT
jgi:hypothetical protein